MSTQPPMNPAITSTNLPAVSPMLAPPPVPFLHPAPQMQSAPSGTYQPLQAINEAEIFPPEPTRSPATRDLWIDTLERVIKGVVSIKATRSHSFDTEYSGSYEGTGFVVDQARGLILSNRHIVGPGPVSARAVFSNYEEVELVAIYYDPVHDFGFFRYDPAKLKFAKVEQIQLFPEGAKVGLDIQVCGSNGGEKWSILSSRLSRLDRQAGQASASNYCDFNINYFQAASRISGGLSGAPVLDIQGRALAITAARTLDQSTALYLPLEGAVRALKLIQEGKNVTRGTLQTEFVHISFHDLRRQGLPEEVEKDCREKNPNGTGLLTVVKVLPQGPGNLAGVENGDVVTECYQELFGRRFVDTFKSLWEIIDDSIGKEIVLTIYRGRERKEISVVVQDLEEITPKTFLDLGNATIHEISYQVARRYNLPCKGLFAVASISGLFNWSTRSGTGPIILSEVDGRPVKTLESFLEVAKSIPDRKRVVIKYRRLVGTECIMLDEMDIRYFPSAEYTLTNGVWGRRAIPLVPSQSIGRVDDKSPVTPEPAETWREKWRQALVWVVCRVPHPVDNMLPGLWSGAGVIIALDPIPTIMVSRSVIPVSLCEISVIISSKYVPAKILYLGGFVIITVDRENMPPIQLPKISTREPKIGDKIEVVGLDSDSQLVHKETQISTITQNNNGMFLPPGWQQPCGTEAIFIRDLPQCAGGVLVDPEDKSLIALWAMAEPSNKFFGLNFQQYIQPILKTLEKGEEVRLWSHGWTFILFQLHSSLDMGVKEPHTSNIRLIARNFNAEPYAVVVSSKIGFKRPVSEENDFKLGDFILQIDGTPVGRTADLRLLAQRESAKVLIMRNGREMQIESKGVAQPTQSTLRIVSWAGLILQKSITGVEPTPEFMASLGKEGIENPDDMIYIAAVTLGGPSIGSLAPATWILEVDNEKVRKLDDILDIIEKNKGSGQNSDEYTRIKVLSRDGSTPIAGIKLDSKLHPAWILEGKEGKWEFRELE